MKEFLEKLWAKIEQPIVELTAHFLVSLCTIAFISLTELVLRALSLDKWVMPVIGMALSEWLFDLDIVAASLILIIGMFRALKEML